MKKALLRLQDLQPGDVYYSEEALIKVKAIADYLKSEGIPIHIALIPRSVVPYENYDKSIAQYGDPYISKFNSLLRKLTTNYNAYLAMHGYTHQYADSVSAWGNDFNYPGCTSNCAPNDPPESCENYPNFLTSYAYSRMFKGFKTFKLAGFNIDCGFTTPLYSASTTQRCIIQASIGLLYENDPDNNTKRTISIKDIENPLYRGVVYIPTPLEYVGYDAPQEDVNRILSEAQTYTENDLASFYYHPDSEFPFITIDECGNVIYNSNSYLKQLVRGLKGQGFTFVTAQNLVNFIPASRITNILPGPDNIILSNRFQPGRKTEFFGWNPTSGNWYFIDLDLFNYPNRQAFNRTNNLLLALNNWAVGNTWKAFVGDFNGDGKEDILVWWPNSGTWQVSLNNGISLTPSKSKLGNYIWLDSWAVGTNWVPFIGDFNGDGKDDILVWWPNSGTWQVALSDGQSFTPKAGGNGNYIWLYSWAAGTNYLPIIGDFNHDGKDDILVYNSSSNSWQIALNLGNKFQPVNKTYLQDWVKGPSWKPLLGDFNSDGKIDILAVDSSKGLWKIALSTDDGFTPKENDFGPWCADNTMQPFVANNSSNNKCNLVSRHPYIENGTFDGAINFM